MFNANLAIENIINGLKASNPSGKAVIGISGGKDSTVVAYLAVKAYGKENVVGVMMPNGEQKDINDSKRVCELLGIKNLTVNIGDAYKSLTGEICVNLMEDFADGNLKNEIPSQYSTNTPARLRMTTLYGVAAFLGGRVLNTCNLSESIIGWETYGGDGFGDYSPLGRLTVTEVILLGEALGIPYDLIHKVPSDGMCGKSDEDKFGFTYDELDKTIREDIQGPHYDKICQMNKKSHFKHDQIRLPTYNPKLHINEVFNWD